ncbi:MAG: Ig-like domain-containing protein [Candidatus Marinimicrobia bacterium]|nr:Ig-like domain-containing protein [Candidatus Neomarinimicrobiota bacterium]
MKWSVLVFLALITLNSFWTCANERAITGGPEDKTAPRILFSTPENESVNIDPDLTIYIKFTEQMKQATFKTALQIWPRPPGDFELKSGWTWLKISFNEPLEQDVTYLLTLDKTTQDLRGNGLESTFVLAFSTGANLNSGHLSGVIHGSKAIKKNGNILLYRQFDIPLQELRKLPADYIFQPDDDGTFELSYLAERSYMLFYHWDRNRNRLLDGDDFFGRPRNASVLAHGDSIKVIHKLWPQLIPLEQFKLLEVAELSGQFIQVRTSRPVTRKTLENIELVADKVILPILGSSLVKEDEHAMHLNTAMPITQNTQVWLTNFQDTSGFSLHSDTLVFYTSTEYDTLEFEDLTVSWTNGSPKRFPNESSSMQIRSNLPFTFRSDSAFQIRDAQVDSVVIPGSLQKSSSMEWVFTPDTLLADGRSFKWEVITSSLYSALNYHDLDSLMTGQLFTVHSDSLGSLRVFHSGSEILECELTGKDIERSFKLKPGLPVLIDHLPAQQYFLSAYVDQNGDGRYNSGGLGPVAGSEPFWFFPTEIRVRARWETDLGEWVLEK